MTKLTEKLAELVPSWGAKLAYAEKTTVDGVEILPVAIVAFGFGGGEGSGEVPEGGKTPAGKGEGSGGGGGGYGVPIGAYLTGPDGVKFRPNTVALLVAAVPVVSAVGWGVAQVIRACKGRGRGIFG
ncbi:hypothetical protein [Protaetiibacter larvae]|uniref:Sporulation protein n=1 Tax=Protaetiibacter larvae TaxID=2592654 RepID=A0A5C1Y7Z6_9MICO|nr:hypothetical protein [Protaetiibacter larvae]QEO09057.1 hypothetical protein FLP23_02910 [Protaetiibacter larvae]